MLFRSPGAYRPRLLRCLYQPHCCVGYWYTQYEKALLRALLEPTAELRKLEAAGDYTARLALLEEQKSLPWQAVWEMYCQRHDTPAGSEWLENVRAYEKEILSRRG